MKRDMEGEIKLYDESGKMETVDERGIPFWESEKEGINDVTKVRDAI